MPKQYEQGKALYNAEKYMEAFPLLLQAARKGADAETRFLLGKIYENGNGVPRRSKPTTGSGCSLDDP